MPQSGIVKYNVKLSFEVDGLVERSDLIGAIFGQTEGLLSPEMNLNELQRVSKVGRIEVKSKTTTTKTGGTVTIPMSTDIDTCSLIAAAIEGIDKVGPFDCAFKMESIDDVRAAKKEDIVKRAQEIKRRWKTKAISEGDTMLKHVHEGNTGRVKSYGPAGIPCGSGAESSPWIILVEGRADIINLLRAGFDNAIAIQGTRIDRSVVELCRKKDKVVAFLDGDRAGGQILRELKATVDVTVALQADPGIEVEELTPDRICEILEPVAKKMNKEAEAPKAASGEDKPLADLAAKIFPDLHESLEAAALDAEKNEVFRTPISELVTRLSGQSGIKYLVLDGIITQKLFEEAKAAGIEYILGHRIARVSDPKGVTLRTFSELGVA